MSNRYDRDYDDDQAGRRDDRDGRPGYRRDDVEHAYGWSGPRGDQRSAPNAQGYNRPNQESREEGRWSNSDERRFGREGNYNRDEYNRQPSYGQSNYGQPSYGQPSYGQSNYGQSGYGPSNYDSSQRNAGRYGDHRSFSDQSFGDRSSSDRWSRGDSDRSRGDYDRFREDRSSSVRGLHQEQAWTRDPSSGNSYGYEYTTRWPGNNTNQPHQQGSRWEENRRDYNRGASTFGNYSEQLRGAGHAGKGPKGYVRSDERIREDISDRLSDDDEIDASDITVTVTKGEVRLEGTVADRHAKHRAEDIAESVSGVRDVSNHLRAKKGFLKELGDKLTGDDSNEHRGHAGSGTRNSPTPNGTVNANR